MESRKPKGVRHNGKLCPLSKRQAIINALAAGKSKRSIARDCRVSHSTVDAIEEQEWAQVSAGQQRLCDQAERNAFVAGEQIREALEQRQYTPSALVPVYGVSLDKAIAPSRCIAQSALPPADALIPVKNGE